MSQNELFQTIINKLTSKYSIKSKIIPTFRYIDNDKSLYIILKYKRKTEYNIFQSIDIFFSITLDEKFPEVPPYVRALTYFSYPNLYDNSNLYNSIILFKDSNIFLKQKNPFLIIEDIILGIPLFLQNIKSNEEKKAFYYYGEYSLNDIYDINEFFFNEQNLQFFRVKQIINNNEFKRYIILNDVYFLLFDPIPDSNNYAKLVFISDLLLLENSKKDKKEKLINFEWKNNNNEIIKMTFKFEETKFNEFIIIKRHKMDKLINTYHLRERNVINDNNDMNKIKNNLNYNYNYNTVGFQISKSFECELLED